MYLLLCPDVILETVGEETVILDSKTARVFTINQTARLIWNHCFHTPQKAVDELLKSTSITEEAARRMVDEFCAALVAAQIAFWSDEPFHS